MVTQRFADTRADEHSRLISALFEASAWCDELENREPLAELLARARYLNVPARVIAPALLGRFECGHGRVEQVPDFHIFHRDGASFPTVGKAAAQQHDLIAAGLLPADTPPALPARLFREDLLRSALHQHKTNELLPSS